MQMFQRIVLLLFVLLLEGAVSLALWDGDLHRFMLVRDVARGQAKPEDLFRFQRLDYDVEPPVLAPAEFYDLVERNYPGDFAQSFDLSTSESLETAYVAARNLGRKIYIREGCFHCHTQYVRPGTPDIDRWGQPSRLDRLDSRLDGLPLEGTRRVGPDLARESNRRSNDWQAAHLYRPRSVLQNSIMPGYPWLFEKKGERLVPNKDGLALIVYLQSLGAEADEDNF